MAIHAAMVDRMDREIGRVLDQLKAMKALDNTLILFLSDNGASAEIMVRDDGHDPAAAARLGCDAPTAWAPAGPRWRTRRFAMHKTWVHEGGISTPLVVHWPAGIQARGELRHNRRACDRSGADDSGSGGRQAAGKRGRQAGSAAPGRSLVPAFAKDNAVTHDSLWWLHEGSKAIRVGDWKLVAASPSLRGRGMMRRKHGRSRGSGSCSI